MFASNMSNAIYLSITYQLFTSLHAKTGKLQFHNCCLGNLMFKHTTGCYRLYLLDNLLVFVLVYSL